MTNLYNFEDLHEMALYPCAYSMTFNVSGELVHVIADAHIYDRHVPIIEDLLGRTPRSAPHFTMDTSVTDFYRFTRDSFVLEGYDPHPFDTKIPVAV